MRENILSYVIYYTYWTLLGMLKIKAAFCSPLQPVCSFCCCSQFMCFMHGDGWHAWAHQCKKRFLTANLVSSWEEEWSFTSLLDLSVPRRPTSSELWGNRRNLVTANNPAYSFGIRRKFHHPARRGDIGTETHVENIPPCYTCKKLLLAWGYHFSYDMNIFDKIGAPWPMFMKTL